MSTTFYLAGRFSRKSELATYAQQIVAAGERVNARWLTGAHDLNTERELTDGELARFSGEDLDDIWHAEVFVLFTESPEAGYMSGGRMVELGYALAKHHRYRIYIIGPHENVFTRLADDRFDTWDDFAKAQGWS